MFTLTKEGSQLHYKGFPLCPGIAFGRPFFFAPHDEKIPEFAIEEDQIDQEIERYYKALKDSRNDLLSLQHRLKQEGGMEAAAILSSHLEIMHDPLMTVQIEEQIRSKGKNTEYVFKTVIGEYERKFSKISDQFFQDRVKDFQDISRRIIRHLRKKQQKSLGALTERVIVFAHELSPSDTAEANTECIEAFVTRSGSATSHVAIMARARGIPFVSNVDFPDFSLSLPPLVIVDGKEGDVVINPSLESINTFKQKRKQLGTKARLQKTRSLEPQTLDGHQIKLSANIEMPNEIDEFEKYEGERVGLFRTEYLFLAQNAFPSEEHQFLVYKSIVEKLDGEPAVIRTFDIGGDKFGDFHPSRYEKNPYLGCRAIRLMLKEKKAFKAQMRAILRASAFGDVRILFPMVSGLEELREVKGLLEEAKQELLELSIPFARTILVGCMIEVPSAALICDLLAKECDFLSIGTNDLVQYCLAVDRCNAAMSYLYTPTHPSIVRLLKMCIIEGRRSNTAVSVCGEIAADPKFTVLLLGLGLQELSVACPAIVPIKNMIRKISIVEATAFADHVLTLSTAAEIHDALVNEYARMNI